MKGRAQRLSRLIVAGAMMVGATVSGMPARAATTTPPILPFLAPTGVGIAALAPVNGIFPVTSATSAKANWMVEQWGNPDLLLSPFVEKLGSSGVTGWLSSNTRGEMQALESAKGSFAMMFYQNGQNMYCGPSASSPLEDDMFLSPNSKSFTSLYPSATLKDTNSTVNLGLGAMTALQVAGAVRLTNVWTPPVASKCSINQGSLIYSLVMVDTVAVPSQIFYYQLVLTPLLCAPGISASAYAGCKAYKPVPNWFEANALTNSSGQVSHYQYGIDDPITSLNLPLLTQSTKPTMYNFNLLPRLKAIIQAGSPAEPGVAQMDTNPANWRISSMYYGQHIWGDIGVQSSWSGMLPAITQ